MPLLFDEKYDVRAANGKIPPSRNPPSSAMHLVFPPINFPRRKSTGCNQSPRVYSPSFPLSLSEEDDSGERRGATTSDPGDTARAADFGNSHSPGQIMRRHTYCTALGVRLYCISRSLNRVLAHSSTKNVAEHASFATELLSYPPFLSPSLPAGAYCAYRVCVCLELSEARATTPVASLFSPPSSSTTTTCSTWSSTWSST